MTPYPAASSLTILTDSSEEQFQQIVNVGILFVDLASPRLDVRVRANNIAANVR